MLAILGAGTAVYDDALPFGSNREPDDVIVSNGPKSGKLFRIETAPDGTHEAVAWKALPGYCEADGLGLLSDGRLYVKCEAGDVILRPDGTLDDPATASTPIK